MLSVARQRQRNLLHFHQMRRQTLCLANSLSSLTESASCLKKKKSLFSVHAYRSIKKYTLQQQQQQHHVDRSQTNGRTVVCCTCLKRHDRLFLHCEHAESHHLPAFLPFQKNHKNISTYLPILFHSHTFNLQVNNTRSG